MNDAAAWVLLVLAALAVVAVAVVGWLGQRRRTAEVVARGPTRRATRGSAPGAAPALFACPVHREATSTDGAASCPVCGQRLEPISG